MTSALLSNAPSGASFPATARLRAGLLISPDAESLVSMFAQALAEHGVDGHFCLRKLGASFVPIIGDRPELLADMDACIIVDTDESFMAGTRVLLARPLQPLPREHSARLRGYAQLFAARALALQEMADDVETECGLSLRERYVLGRRLAGLAPVDIAIEAELSVATVSAAIDSAIVAMGAHSLAEAISLAARRGWLAVTNVQNCSSTCHNSTYKTIRNG